MRCFAGAVLYCLCFVSSAFGQAPYTYSDVELQIVEVERGHCTRDVNGRAQGNCIWGPGNYQTAKLLGRIDGELYAIPLDDQLRWEKGGLVASTSTPYNSRCAYGGVGLGDQGLWLALLAARAKGSPALLKVRSDFRAMSASKGKVLSAAYVKEARAGDYRAAVSITVFYPTKKPTPFQQYRWDSPDIPLECRVPRSGAPW